MVDLNLNVTVSDLINLTNVTELAGYVGLIQELLYKSVRNFKIWSQFFYVDE